MELLTQAIAAALATTRPETKPSEGLIARTGGFLTDLLKGLDRWQCNIGPMHDKTVDEMTELTMTTLSFYMAASVSAATV